MTTAIEFIRTVNELPQSKEGACMGSPSMGEVRRWLRNGSVIINRKRATAGDKVRYPIRQLLFFPLGSLRTTLWNDYRRRFRRDFREVAA